MEFPGHRPAAGQKSVISKSLRFNSCNIDFRHLFCFFCDLQKVRLRRSGLTHEVKVQFLWYGARAGRDRSGAYLFLPENNGAQVRVRPGCISLSLSQPLVHSECVSSLHQLYSHTDPPVVRVSSGPVFSDITSCFRHFTHRVRMYHLDGNDGFTPFMCLSRPAVLRSGAINWSESTLRTTLTWHSYYTS